MPASPASRTQAPQSLSTRTVTVAVGQFAAEVGAAQENLDAIDRLAGQAAAQGAGFILFPEDCVTGLPVAPGSAVEVAVLADGPEAQRLSALAGKHGITIAAGLIERRGQAVNTSHWVAFPDGRRLLFRKHSSDALERSIGLTTVHEPDPDFPIGGLPAALAICSDGTPAFLEGVRRRGAKLILHPSAGACLRSIRQADPEADDLRAAEIANSRRCLERAQRVARETGAAYLCANPVGFDGLRYYPGNSWVVGPDGAVLAHLVGTSIAEEMREGIGVGTITV